MAQETFLNILAEEVFCPPQFRHTVCFHKDVILADFVLGLEQFGTSVLILNFSGCLLLVR
jgi:hypothetical protein